MPQKLQDVVTFRGDRLFNGAISINWFGTDHTRSRAASEAFVFHGPQYHGVSQADVGTSHGHRLQDTADFTRSVVRRCYGLEDQPFTLAIAGYGTGKSHLGLTLANLLCNPKGPLADTILSGLDAADETLGAEIQAILAESGQPCLVIALNGMQSFDLTAEVTRQVMRHVKERGLDTRPLDDLRPRFRQAVTLVEMSTDAIVNDLVAACEVEDRKAIVDALERQEEALYAKVHEFFSSRGIPIRALGGESARDVIDVTVREYCGKDKPYRSLVFLFDEFGRYTEFATIRSQIAGSGVLQDLFEGIQDNASAACFVGFIQFELNAYVQRVAAEHKNEILRYVTRYQSANRVYLSINLETLIASLLEKRKRQELDRWFDGETKLQESAQIAEKLGRWFPQSRNHRLWGDASQFHTVIRKGCWPLSPYSTWFLFYLAAAGKHLQERSALALLGDAYGRFENTSVPDDGNWCLAPADLWSDEVQQELILSEEGGQQGSVTHAYASVMARHGGRLQEDLKRILRAVVLASKMGLQAADRRDAIEALSELAGIPLEAADKGVRFLQEEYNILEWDEAFKEFDILGDAVPRTQFLSFVRHRVASSYDESGKATLFASRAATWCELLADLECDFAEENRITTREWRYQGVTSNLELLPMHLKLAADRWTKAISVDDPRGTVAYCYVEPSSDVAVVTTDAAKLLRAAAKEVGAPALPVLVVLLCDEDGALGQALAELAVLEESLSEEDRVRFGNLVGAHKEKMRQVIRSHIETMIRQRRYVTSLREELEAQRLIRAGTELFARIYKSPIPFPFDGFSTAKGNAADSCQDLTVELLRGKLDYDAVIAKPTRTKNRAITVLKDTWGVFSKDGKVLIRPSYPVVRTITEKWDGALAAGEKRLPIALVLRQLCQPPHGANVASAAMLLGVFVAPRSDRLIVVRDGQQIALSQWLQDGAFKGKFIDVRAQASTDLMLLGEESSEWEALLKEWEQAETYFDRSECLERCIALRRRIPVPPALGYLCTHLEQRAQDAIKALKAMEAKQNDAMERIERGEHHEDAGMVAWGAADLVKLSKEMATQGVVWAGWQVNEMQPHVERAKQVVIQMFPEWLRKQAPLSDAPSIVGDWKHKMLRLTGGNLKALSLEEQYNALEQHVLLLARNAESVAEARQLVRDVGNWLAQHTDACRIVRVAAIRGLVEIGKGFASRLQGMGTRVALPEVSEVRSRLAGSLQQLKDAQAGAKKRTSKLLGSKPRSAEELRSLRAECDDLIRVFEGCEADLRDLHALGRGIGALHRAYARLEDERLTWTKFEGLAIALEQEVTGQFEPEELPWSIDETIGLFVKTLSRSRKDRGEAWVGALESDAESIEGMSAADANRLHVLASAPPAYITDKQLERTAQVMERIETRLSALAVEWLLEKFKELPLTARQAFLDAVGRLMKR